MGIVNVTPDSFYDGGTYLETQKAVEYARELIDNGADIIDIGGESTRPGASSVSLETELERVIPVIKQLAQMTRIPVSIDTTKSEVARQALEAGACIINDISGLRFDPKMVTIAKDYHADIVVMHMSGTPETMQNNPHYTGWVVDDICSFFTERISYLESQGIQKNHIILDPGIGFGKSIEHNLDIIAHAHIFKQFGIPVLYGPSNKSFLQPFTSANPEDRMWGTAGITAYLLTAGIDIIRVHNVHNMAIIKNVLSAIKQRLKETTPAC
ncbi:dihydropteroate synthase [bacterium]|nr:dihydropteroate synthase [bacterium]MCP5463291.1 dihydropteroate synthase [bacterium]